MNQFSSDKSLIEHLEDCGAVYRNLHFVGTGDDHLNGFINMREVAHHADLWDYIGKLMADLVKRYDPHIIIGAETLGRTVAQAMALHLGIPYIWCDVETDPVSGKKSASFKEKLPFDQYLTKDTRCVAADDLLTSGSTNLAVNHLISSFGAIPVVTAVVIRRNQSVNAQGCGSQHLECLEDVTGFKNWSEEECKQSGPCSTNTPMVARPGHGHEWLQKNPSYPHQASIVKSTT